MRWTRLLTVCILAGAVAPAAAPREAPEGASYFAPVATGITKERAVGIVRERFDGRVLSAATAMRDGERGFDVRVLVAGGRVKNVFVDRRGGVAED